MEIILVIVLIAACIGWIIKNYKTNAEPAQEVLSRKDYYNKVYLKSNAWKRKRYVVLKRDNWKCIYCGAKAQQVHHKNSKSIKFTPNLKSCLVELNVVTNLYKKFPL